MNTNELFIEFGTTKQRKAFQKWLEKGGGFQSFLQYAASQMVLHEQPMSQGKKENVGQCKLNEYGTR